MTRKRYAVGGNLSDRINRRNYWFDENDGVTSESNYTPEPTTQPTYNVASTNNNVTNTNNNVTNRTRRTSQTNKSNNSSNNIVTIGARSFGDAFKQARNAGLDKFRWRGRVYGTRYASEVDNNNNVQGNTNTNVRSNTSTKNNPSNIGTKATTTPRRTSSSKPTSTSPKPATQQTNASRTSGTTAKTTYTRNANGYAQLPEVIVTAPAKKKTNTNIIQRSLQTVRGAVNRLEGSERFPISVPSDLRKTKYSEDFKRDLIMHRRYGIPNTPMYYKGKWYK